MKRSDDLNQQLIIHAIGDLGIKELLDLHDRLKIENGKTDRRFRIEHVQHVDIKHDLDRFDEDIVCSLQYTHMAEDGRWAHHVLDEDVLEGSWMFKSFIDRKAKVVLGSDWFVTHPIPLMGMHAAVSRKTLEGVVFQPQEKVDM